MAKKERYTNPEIQAAADACAEIMAQHITLSTRHDALVCKQYNQTGPRVDYTDEIEAIRQEMRLCDERQHAASAKLDAAYGNAGIRYSGTECDTDYNMYTYRDIERKAVRIFQAA